jgi:hypothetical protein
MILRFGLYTDGTWDEFMLESGLEILPKILSYAIISTLYRTTRSMIVTL